MGGGESESSLAKTQRVLWEMVQQELRRPQIQTGLVECTFPSLSRKIIQLPAGSTLEHQYLLSTCSVPSTGLGFREEGKRQKIQSLLSGTQV